MVVQHQLPLNSSGYVLIVAASLSKAPYTFINGLKFDAQGRVVVAG